MSTSAVDLVFGRRGLVQLVRAARIEVTLAVTGLIVLALHVLDDNFLQPQPGTSAADHLASGLVPTAVLLAGAAAYPRLRAGLRATVALLLGAFGVLIGAGEAGYYALEISPSGDDYTGLLAIPAGALLVALGAMTLWRSRKRQISARATRTSRSRRATVSVCRVGTSLRRTAPP